MGGKTKSGRGTGLAPVTVKSAKLLTDGTDERFRRLINNLHSLGAFFGKVSAKLLAVMNLPPSQHHILRVVAELGAEEAVNVNRVAGLLHMNPTQVTRELNDLVRLRFVKKTPSLHDRRQVLLTITDRGLQVLEEIAPVLQEINETLFRDLSKEDFENLCGLMKTLTENVDSALLAADLVTENEKRKVQLKEVKVGGS
jgi:DNA-binding MarR family transcriptional regulator